MLARRVIIIIIAVYGCPLRAPTRAAGSGHGWAAVHLDGGVAQVEGALDSHGGCGRRGVCSCGASLGLLRHCILCQAAPGDFVA